MDRKLMQINTNRFNTMFKRKEAMLDIVNLEENTKFQRPIAERRGRFNYILEHAGIAYSRLVERGYCSATCLTDTYEEMEDTKEFISFQDLKQEILKRNINVPLVI